MEQRDTLVHGYAYKLKNRRKRYFSLTVDKKEYLAPSLAIYENENKWKKNLEPRILSLSNLFFVEELQRKKISNGLGLYMETSFLGMSFQDNAQLQKWNDELGFIVHENKKRLHYPKIDHAWEASVKFKPRGIPTGFLPAAGNYRVCLGSREVLILNTCIMSPTLAIDYCYIRNSYSRIDGQFKLELGHMAPTGDCDIVMQMADDKEAKFALKCITQAYDSPNTCNNLPRYRVSSRRSVDMDSNDTMESKSINSKRFSSPPIMWSTSNSIKSDSRLSEISSDVEMQDGTFSSAETIKNSLHSPSGVSEYLIMEEPRTPVFRHAPKVSPNSSQAPDSTPSLYDISDETLPMKYHADADSFEMALEEFPIRANSVGARITQIRNSFVSCNSTAVREKIPDSASVQQNEIDTRSNSASQLSNRNSSQSSRPSPPPSTSSGKRSNDSLSRISNFSHRDNEEIFMEMNFSQSPRSRAASDASKYRDRNNFHSRFNHGGMRAPIINWNSSFRDRASQSSMAMRPNNLNRLFCLPNQSSSSSEIQDEYMDMSSTVSSDISIEKMAPGSNSSNSSLNGKTHHSTTTTSAAGHHTVAMPTTPSSLYPVSSGWQSMQEEPLCENDSLYPVCNFSDQQQPAPVLLFEKSKFSWNEGSASHTHSKRFSISSVKSDNLSPNHLYANI